MVARGWERSKLGPTVSSEGELYLIRLLEDRASLRSALDEGSGSPQLQGAWRTFLTKVQDARTGTVPLHPCSD